MLITRVLNKLIQDVQQTKKPHYAQVERACNSALQDIRSVDSEGENEHKVLRQKSLEYEQSEDVDDATANLDLLVGEEVRPQMCVDSEKFFIPFELACKGDIAKITIAALDGVQKLVAYGELIGDFPDPKTPTRRLIDRIVDTVCSCHVGLETDEGVELQIIKALLTIVTSEQVQVHDSTLLQVLRTCYIIHLTTKSVVNQRTTKAMLTQMLHSIFQRVEVTAKERECEKRMEGHQSVNDNILAFKDWDIEFVALARQCLSHSVLSVPSDLSQPTLFPQHEQKSNLYTMQESAPDINQNSQQFAEKAEEHHENQQNELYNGSLDHDQPDPKDNNENARTTVENVDQEQNTTANAKANPFLEAAPQNSQNIGNTSTTGNNRNNVMQKDAFLSFWTLTKLAHKAQNKPESEKEIKNATETKYQQPILAFHLLKEILERSGNSFKTSPIFINAMKHHLYHAMIENGISANSQIFQLQVEIIMLLMTKFQEIMVEEIQMLLDAIVFPVLELTSSYSSDYSKILLKSLKDISHNLDCFVNLFLHCDSDASNELKPFRRLVASLSKIVRENLGHEELAVQAIANLLKSMSAACPKLEDGNIPDVERLERSISYEDDSPKFVDDTVQNLELEGEDFLTCLHLFLGEMIIPCDVLKTDWLIQKLAQRMTDTSSVNSLHTETADCWYSLIYASMSLIADIKITNCQGKSKMNKSQFIKLNRAINGCEPLDGSCLSSVYDEIEANYKRDDDVSEQGKWFGKNEKEILEVIKYILESTSLLRSHFSLGKQLKHVKRMIKICGTSFLIALISALQNTNDTKLSDVCLDGIHSGIRVACILGLDSEREAYVQALAKLSATALDEIRGKHIYSKIVTTTTSSLTMTENGVTKTVVTTTTEMKCRSVDIVLTLLDVGIAEGNHLGGSWLHILKFISQLLSTPLLAESRNSSRSSSPVPPAQGSNSGSGWAAWAGSLKESLEKKLWDPSISTVLHPSAKESIANAVEKVFKRSEMLTGDGAIDFFQALCQVSLTDMMNSETPKHLMYEKINQVADGNFFRPALQWSQIWQVVADYLCHLACSSKEEISTLAIESIQKLVLKLLKKETLNGYRFQNHYFSPFKVIITNTRSQSTREAVLGFVETVISLHGDLLLSGWIAILSILVANMLSHNDDPDAGADSFRVLQHIVDKCQKGEVNLRNSYGSIVKSLIDIAGNIAPTLEMSEQAFRLLTQLAEIPYSQPQLLMEENDDKRYRVWARGWKPILGELSFIVCCSDGVNNDSIANSKVPSWDIKTKALITLFEVIKAYGSSFEEEWWNSVFEVLFNIFNCIKSHEKQDLMFAIFDVYIQFYDATGSYVFDELLKHLQWCICQDAVKIARQICRDHDQSVIHTFSNAFFSAHRDNAYDFSFANMIFFSPELITASRVSFHTYYHEQIALSGVSCLQQLVVALGKRFSVNQWDSILNVFQTFCKPADYKQTNNLEHQSERDNVTHVQPLAIRAVMQLELLKILNNVIFCGERSRSTLSTLSEEGEWKAQISDGNDAPIDEINPLLTSSQVSLILEILNRSHEIAKNHCILDGDNSENRESSQQGKQEIPNFIPHETLSLQIYWKILFSMFKTESSQTNQGIPKEAVWEMIQKSCIRSCGYFVTIQFKEHRDAWADLLCFTMNKILGLPKPNFETLTSHLYPYFCEMLEADLDSKICDKLREYLIVLGRDYNITLYSIEEKRESAGAFGSDEPVDVLPKTCNTTAHSHFQRTCITENINEAYVNQSKDFQ